MEHHQLVAENVTYYSSGDERAFFEWLRSIACIKDTKGIGRELIISLARTPSDDELRELIGLFYRYNIDMHQLAAFVSDANQIWLRKADSYWFERMFEQPPISN
jgi:hypothetical protein